MRSTKKTAVLTHAAPALEFRFAGDDVVIRSVASPSAETVALVCRLAEGDPVDLAALGPRAVVEALTGDSALHVLGRMRVLPWSDGAVDAMLDRSRAALARLDAGDGSRSEAAGQILAGALGLYSLSNVGELPPLGGAELAGMFKVLAGSWAWLLSEPLDFSLLEVD